MHALYPHLKGKTSLAYSKCGKYVFTAGENMLLRRFITGSKDEPDVYDLEYQTGRSVATSGSKFAVAYDNGSADLFDVESFSKIGTLVRTSLPLHSVTFSKDGEWLSVVGDDCCKVIRTLDIADIKNVRADDVRHISFNPKRAMVITASCLDGSVQIFDLIKDRCIATLESIVPTVKELDDEKSTAAVWSPDGHNLALPTKTFEIVIISSANWLVQTRLAEEGHSNSITAMQFSPNGRYLASAARDSKVLIWDVLEKKVVQKFDIHDVIEIDWHPFLNEIGFTTNKGQLYTGTALPEDLPAPFGDVIEQAFESGIEAEKPADISMDRAINLGLGSDSGEKDLSDEDLFVSDDSDNDRSRKSHRRGSFHSQIQNKRPRLDLNISNTSGTQAPFQSGATPWINQKRYLCMSPLGYVWTVRQSTDHHTTTICFFDQSIHRELHFHDNDMFDLASLSSQACLFANSRTGKFALRFHSSITDNWEVQLDLKLDLGITAVCLSSDVAVIFTKSGFMRCYALYGTPLNVTKVGGGSGSVICCAAFQNEVIYVQQQGSNCYTYTFEDIALSTYHQKADSMEITPNNNLKSLFFNEDGDPCFMDSKHILCTLVHSRVPNQARWVPIFSDPNPDPEINTTYWPLGILDSKLLCIPMRGQKVYPSIPLPLTDEFELFTPGLEGYESQHILNKASLLQLQDRVKVEKGEDDSKDIELLELVEDQIIENDKLLLRQFQSACEHQRINKCLQIAELIQSDEPLRAAAKLAAAYNLSHVAELILATLD